MYLGLVMTKVAIVITARLASTRIPGKVYLRANGKFLLSRLIGQVAQAFPEYPIYLTSESEKVLSDFVHERVEPVLTGEDVRSGSERLARLSTQVESEYYLLVPCDIWLDTPDVMVEFLEDCLRKQSDCATLAKSFTDDQAFAQAANVKVLHDQRREAIFFARILPMPLQHYKPYVAQQLGLYFYSHKALQAFLMSPPTAIERNEENESFRFLMNGWRMYCSITERSLFSLNTPDDLNALSAATGLQVELHSDHR